MTSADSPPLRVQTAFHQRAQAASEAHRRTGESVPVETVLTRLQSRLVDKRRTSSR